MSGIIEPECESRKRLWRGERQWTMDNDSPENDGEDCPAPAQLGHPPLAFSPSARVQSRQPRQSAGKACPDEVGSKPPSNWGAYVHEHEAAERRKFFPWRAGGERRSAHAGHTRTGQGRAGQG